MKRRRSLLKRNKEGSVESFSIGDSAREFLVADVDQPGGVNVILIPPVSTGIWMFHIVVQLTYDYQILFL